MAQLRGDDISMIFQEPMTALNPVKRIGAQIDEVFELHKPGITREEAREASISILGKVGLPAPEIRVDEYPHQLSAECASAL